jgi:predicted metal-dependent HD superfamily phosphohydrolase
MDLKQNFIELFHTYCNNQEIVSKCWNEIEVRYGGKKRYYHNFTHIKTLIDELLECKYLVNDWDTLLFSVFYHDIIYNVLKGDNEERSAEVAVQRLSAISFPEEKIQLCKEEILATKNHKLSENNDVNLFTDADLSILGQSTDVYQQYCSQIRKEYSIYPDIIYKPGRRKVIDHFLSMGRIFKTNYFYDKYEQQARINLLTELDFRH